MDKQRKIVSGDKEIYDVNGNIGIAIHRRKEIEEDHPII